MAEGAEGRRAVRRSVAAAAEACMVAVEARLELGLGYEQMLVIWLSLRVHDRTVLEVAPRLLSLLVPLRREDKNNSVWCRSP